MAVAKLVTVTPDDPSTLSLAQLRTTVEVQQRSLHFLLVNWDNMSTQVEALSVPQVFGVGAYIPAGVWRSISPPTGAVGFMYVQGASVLLTAPGPFVSDGTAVSNIANLTLVRSAAPPTPLP